MDENQTHLPHRKFFVRTPEFGLSPRGSNLRFSLTSARFFFADLALKTFKNLPKNPGKPIWGGTNRINSHFVPNSVIYAQDQTSKLIFEAYRRAKRFRMVTNSWILCLWVFSELLISKNNIEKV